MDTEWRWEYPQVINEYLRKTMEDNFTLFEKYPHYVFNFSGANRYRFMKEYYPEDFAKLQKYVAAGRWFPAGSSMEEGDVNAPSAEAIIRQILYGNDWFRKEFGKASAEYMLPDCFGFPASLPTILAHSGVKGFSTQKLVWGSKPLPPLPPNTALEDLTKKVQEARQKIEEEDRNNKLDPNDLQRYYSLRRQRDGLNRAQQENELDHHQDDWAARVQHNGEVNGVFTDYHYYGTGDIGGAPDEDSVKRLEAIVTKGTASLPRPEQSSSEQPHSDVPPVAVGDGPVHVISANAEQMFLDITPAQAKGLPRYTGEM